LPIGFLLSDYQFVRKPWVLKDEEFRSHAYF